MGAENFNGRIRVNVKGVKELEDRFTQMPVVVREALIHEVTDITFEVAARSRRRASGEILKVKTGRFLRAIRPRINISEYRVRGRVMVSGIGRLAGLLQFGGKTKPRDIAPKNAKSLHFTKGGSEIFAGLVHHPGARIGRHPIVYGALDEMRDQIVDRLSKAAIDASVNVQGSG